MKRQNSSQARTLRKNMTFEERLLWQKLKKRQMCGKQFRRQYPIGEYIVDFVCFESRLIVECDGSQHCDSSYDQRRDNDLIKRNFNVMRFWNHDIRQNTNSVISKIKSYIETTE